jgi:hypothetical protein
MSTKEFDWNPQTFDLVEIVEDVPPGLCIIKGTPLPEIAVPREVEHPSIAEHIMDSLDHMQVLMDWRIASEPLEGG